MDANCSTRMPEQPICRVLLLEDDQSLVRIMKLLLEREGFQVTAAYRGQEALRLLGEQQFHLAVVDIDLPDTTGFQVMNQANENGWLGNLKIVFWSGNPSDDRVEMASRFKNSRFLEKPFDLVNLFSILRSLHAVT